MDSYFCSEFENIEKELVRLKTSNSKSAGVVQTVAKKITVAVPLSLNQSQTTARGYVDYNVTPEQDAIIMCTLDWYSGDVSIDHRIPRTVRGASISESDYGGVRVVRVSVNGTQFGNNNDVQRLINGESVVVNVNLSIRATCDFTIMEKQ